MYVPPAFREDDLPTLHGIMRAVRLATVVTQTREGLLATPLPLFVDPDEGPYGTLYGHLARANPQARLAAEGDAIALFTTADAYVSPSYYTSKREHGKVVPTWNYVAVHAWGPTEIFDEPARLLDVVTRLTDLHERPRAAPWAVSDAPEGYIPAQLRGIVGLRMPIARLAGKRKMSQNRSDADRAGVATGLAESALASERAVAPLVRP